MSERAMRRYTSRRRSDTAQRERATTRSRRPPLPCGRASTNPGTAAVATDLGAVAAATWSSERARSTPAQAGTPTASDRSAMSRRGSLRQRQQRQEPDQRDEHQAEVLPNGQELHAIGARRNRIHRAFDRYVQPLPEEIADHDDQA